MRFICLCLIALIAALLNLSGASPAYAAEPGPPTATIAKGLRDARALAVLPDGGFLVAEREGRLVFIAGDGRTATAINGLPNDIMRYGQGGLLDLALDPAFAQNRRIYLSYTRGNTAASTVTVIAATLQGNFLAAPTVIFESWPAMPGTNRFGGRMAIVQDPQSYASLFIALGDRGESGEAQDLRNDLGKIVRVTTNGAIPFDNPYPSKDKPRIREREARPEIFAYGVRDPRGLAVEPQTGLVWFIDADRLGRDDLNILVPERNYGWSRVSRTLTPNKTVPGTLSGRIETDPVVSWRPEGDLRGLAFYAGSLHPAWNGALMAVSNAKSELRVAKIIGQTLGRRTDYFDLPLNDVRVTPSGEIYLLTGERDGRLLRILPAAR